MVKLEIKETDINKAKSWSESVYLDDDLLLTEHINKAPMPTEPRKMNFILIGLCMKGQIEYRLDTQEININPGDMLIVSDKHIVDKYKPSPDMEGLCMILSVNFFHEIIKNVRDVNSLFIFSRSHPVIGLTTKEQETFKEYFHVIKHKIGDQDNFFRKDLIRTLLLAMFYDVGNIIYRFKETDKPQTRAEAILTKAPSAELRPNQKDSDSLPEYELLDPVLHALCEEELSPEQVIARGTDAALVERVVKLKKGAAFKVLQIPPVLTVGTHPIVPAFKQI